MEMAGEDINGLILLQERWHDTIQVQPIVEYQDGLFRFQDIILQLLNMRILIHTSHVNYEGCHQTSSGG